MAADCVALMRIPGHDRFCLAGHDRGSYVARRVALDYPDSVRRLCLMEGIPIGEALARCDARFAARWYHWFFFGQTDRPAERVIWRDWADDVRGQSLDCGHHLAEEAPLELAALLTAFFAPVWPRPSGPACLTPRPPENDSGCWPPGARLGECRRRRSAGSPR